MDDRQKESLSALLDNETDELELRRLVQANSKTQNEKLTRYAAVSHILQNPDGMVLDIRSKVMEQLSKEEDLKHKGDMSEDAFLESASVSQEKQDLLEGAPSAAVIDKSKGADQDAGSSSVFAWAQIAVAASVAFVVALTFSWVNENSAEVAGAGQSLAENTSNVLNQRAEERLTSFIEQNYSPVNINENIVQGALLAESDKPASVEMNESISQEQRKLLNEYLLRHAGNGFIGSPQTVAPYARLASFGAAGDDSQ